MRRNWKAKRIESRGEMANRRSLTSPRKYRRGRRFEPTIRCFPGWPQFLNIEREFERDFEADRTVVREKNVPQRRRNDFPEARASSRRLVRKSRRRERAPTRGLPAMAAAMAGWECRADSPTRRYGIRNLAAVLISETRLRTAEIRAAPIGAFLRERVPQMQIGCAHDLWKRLPGRNYSRILPTAPRGGIFYEARMCPIRRTLPKCQWRADFQCFFVPIRRHLDAPIARHAARQVVSRV